MSHLAQNLAALAQHFPDLAATIQSTPIPEGFLPTSGTDGTPTFSRTTTQDSSLKSQDSPKRRDWLGGTSMPAASAPHIIASLNPLADGHNGLALSIGTGFEWAAFLTRLPRAQLLYLYEPDPALLRLALEICDLSAHFASRRLIPLTGTPDQAAETLATFLAANLGFDPPAVLHPLPSLPQDRRHALLAAGESIVRHALTQHQLLLSKLNHSLTLSLSHNPIPTPTPSPSPSQIPNSQFPIPNSPPLALLLTPRHPAERPLHQHISTQHIIPTYLDHHATASAALRLKLLTDHLARGPVRILSDLFRPQLAVIPPEIPIETWIPPLAGPAYWDLIPPPAALSPQDRLIVHFAHHHSTLLSHHIPPSQITLLPLSPHLTPNPNPNLNPNPTPSLSPSLNSSSPIPNSQSPIPPSPRRLALLADLPPSSAESLAIVLPTHQSVFAAARDLILADYLTVHPALAPDLLRRALLRVGIDSKNPDPALQDPMLRILRDVLIPALPPLALAAALVREGFPLTLIGNWPGLQTSLADIKSIPFDSYTPAVWQDVALFLHFSPQGTFSPILWHALAASIPLLSPQHPTDPLPGSLPQLLTPEKQFAHPLPKNLIPTLKSLLRDSPRRQKLAASALSLLAKP